MNKHIDFEEEYFESLRAITSKRTFLYISSEIRKSSNPIERDEMEEYLNNFGSISNRKEFNSVNEELEHYLSWLTFFGIFALKKAKPEFNPDFDYTRQLTKRTDRADIKFLNRIYRLAMLGHKFSSKNSDRTAHEDPPLISKNKKSGRER